MTEQQFSDGLLWVFGVFGFLMVLLLIVILASYLTYKIKIAIREHKLSKRIGGMTWPRPTQW
jgi:hypothetical protein